MEGETVELEPASILVSSEARPGLAVSGDKYATVGIDTTLTPELKLEGLAREVVRLIQDMRKKAGFNIEDRITTCYLVEGVLAQAFEAWGDYIQAETLTTKLLNTPPIEGAFVEEFELEGDKVTLAVKQNK